MSSLFFAITKFLDICCVNAVRLCAISINTAYIAHHLNKTDMKKMEGKK
jgi:hypothetical protein